MSVSYALRTLTDAVDAVRQQFANNAKQLTIFSAITLVGNAKYLFLAVPSVLMALNANLAIMAIISLQGTCVNPAPI